MLKGLLALGAIIALSTVACADLVGADFSGYNSSSPATPANADGTQPLPEQASLPDGGKRPNANDGGSTASPDGGPTKTDGAPPGPTSCVGPKPAAYPNKLSTLKTFACTTAQATAANNVFNTPGKTLADVYASMAPGACRECVFTPETAAEWGPVVKLQNGGFRFNYGHCLANVQGGSDACSVAAQTQFYCIEEVCATCASQAELDACWDKAAAGPCKPELDAATAACPAAPWNACAQQADVLFAYCRIN